MSEFLYMLKVVCHRGCGREVIGPVRKESDGEFPEKVVERFYADIVEAGWFRGKNNAGLPRFQCNDPRCEEWSKKIVKELKRDFKLTKEQRKRLKYLKPVNPDYFTKVTVKNLESRSREHR